MPRPKFDERDDLPAMPPQVPRLDGAPSKAVHVPAPLPNVVPAPAQKPEPKEFELRPGDSGEDRPSQVPMALAPLSDADLKALAAEEERLLQRELREAEELIASEPSVLGLPSVLSHPLMGAVVVGMAAVLGLFVFNQFMQALSLLGSLQGFWMYGGYVGLGLLAGGVVYAMLRLVWLYVRLRRNKQLRLKGLEELEKRTKLRWLVNAKVKEAKTQLVTYLREFPLAEGRQRKRLSALGINEGLMIELVQVREKLLDANRWPSDDVWFTAFRDSFQARLDEAAALRVNYWARRTAVGTAVSPNTLTDTMMTLYFSFTMLADLCQVYNLRAGRLGTAVLLARVFFNAYLAGQINEMENMTAEQIQNLVAPHIPTSELLLAKVLGKVGAKASAGVINFFLLNRLGKYASRMLRPVTRD
jgi:putative membrane protein